MTTPVVTLDAGNTLFTERLGRDALYAEVLRAHGADTSAVQLTELRHRIDASMPEVYGGHVRYSDGWFSGFMLRLFDALGLRGDPEVVRAELADRFTRPESYVLFADTLPALDDLAERGARLALVSNWSTRLRDLLDGLGLTRYFEVLVISAEVGHSKPAAGIFEAALRQLDVDAAHVTHVGDHPVKDVAGARRAGLSALLVDRNDDQQPGPHVISSLEQVSTRLFG